MILYGVFYGLLVISYLCAIALYSESSTYRRSPLVFGVLLCMCYSFYCKDSADVIFAELVAIVTIFVSMTYNLRTRLRNVFLAFLIVDCFLGITESAVSAINGLDKINAVSVSFIEPLALCALFFSLALFIRRRLKSATADVSSAVMYSEKVYGIYYSTVVFLSVIVLFVIAILRSSYTYIAFSMLRPLFIMTIILAYLAIVGIVIIYITVANTDRQMQEMLQQQVMMNTMQEQYYKTLLEKEDATKQFRHDMNNHLLTLSYLAGSNGDKAVGDYIESLRDTLHRESEHIVVTGNSLIDTLSVFYLERLPSPDMMRICGSLSEVLFIDQFHITTIYANLLQNAVEAVLDDPRPEEEKRIRVEFSSGNATFSLKIENTFYNGKKTMYIWGDERGKHHGYGLSNVRRAVADLGGVYECVQKEGLYTTTVLLTKE